MIIGRAGIPAAEAGQASAQQLCFSHNANICVFLRCCRKGNNERVPRTAARRRDALGDNENNKINNNN